MKKETKLLLPLFFVLAIISAVAAFAAFAHYMNFSKDVTVVIEEGDTPASVIAQIKKHNAMPALNYVPSRLVQKIIGSKIKTGIYKVVKEQSFIELAMKIRYGIAEKCSITFIPGKTIYDYKKQLEENPDFRGIITVEVVEGEILPDTYTFFCGISKNTVLKHAKEQMRQFLNVAVSNVNFNAFYLKNASEVIIMASIIEKETGVNSERNKVAAVFKNRLALKMRLQTDPTVIYQESLGTGTLGRALTTADLKKQGDYNTYTIPALPIGAISNPSRESILAALNPAETDSLYFVATPHGNGRHNFAKTYAQHLHNVSLYRNRGNYNPTPPVVETALETITENAKPKK